MTNSFYIKSIKSISNSGKESKIDFIDGFNLVHGPSNTGKTLILKSIDFLFGAEKFEGLPNQKYLEMEIDCKPGIIKLRRNIDENKSKVHVTSNVSGIESGEYSTGHAKQSLSDLLLRIIGIEEQPIKIVRNEDFKTQNLTWRTFLHMFFLKESEILREESILAAKPNSANTAFRSALLFLITGQNQDHLEREESPENIKLKNQAIKNYVNRKLEEISKIESQISEPIQRIDKQDIEKQLHEALLQINYNNSKLTQLVDENRILTKKNNALFNKREENSLSIRNFRELVNQYKIDASRLSLILDGQEAFHNHKNEKTCPFCDSKIIDGYDSFDLDNVVREYENLKIKSDDLEATISFLVDEERSIDSELEKNQNVINENSAQINEILNPSIRKLEATIKEYSAFLKLLTEKETLQKMGDNWIQDLSSMDDKELSDNKYKPIDRYPRNFFSTMANILTNLLDTCSFPNLSTARFDKSTLDVVINGETKASQGKGYRAYLNSIVALATQNYLYEYGVYTTPLFIVDTPLLGLDEIIQEHNGDAANVSNMRLSFYKYLIEIGNQRQVIVIDNNKDLPEINFEQENIHNIEFTKSKTFGRYGFLSGIFD